MKRPVAVAGAATLFTLLLSASLPRTAIGLSVAFFVLLFFLLRGIHAPKVLGQYMLLVAVTVCAAALLRMGYYGFFIRPVRALKDTTHVFTASVTQVYTRSWSDAVSATLRVEQLDDKPCAAFSVRAKEFPDVSVGERLRFTATLTQLSEEEAATVRLYAKGVYGEVSQVEHCQTAPQRFVLTQWLGSAKKSMSGAVRRYLDGDIGAVAAAMSVGDRTQLTSETQEAFRGAGLAHVLVVSGMHLTIVSGGVYAWARRRLRRRKAAVCGMAATLLFVLVAGATPSLLRAAVTMLVYYVSLLCSERTDAPTSLGLAALLLSIYNPYAVADVGFQLSFCATAGVMAAASVVDRRYADADFSRFTVRMGRGTAALVAVPIGAALFTFPVLAANGMPVSPMGLLSNILAVPLLGFITSTGLGMALSGQVGWLWPVTRSLGLLCGLAIKLLCALAEWVSHLPWSSVYVTSVTAICAVVGTAVLAWLGVQCGYRFRRAFAMALLFLFLCTAGYAALDVGVTRVAFLGSGVNQAVVFTQGTHTAVLFQGEEGNVRSVQTYLKETNRTQVDLLVDLRRSGDAELVEDAFAARQTVFAKDLINGVVLRPFHGIIVTIRHQKSGNYACVNAGGRTVGLACGSVDISSYPACTVLCAGTNAPKGGVCDTLLLPPTAPAWLSEGVPTDAKSVRQGTGQTRLLLRAHTSMKWRENELDFT